MKLDDQKQRLDSVRDLVDMLKFFEGDGRVDVESSGSGGSYGGYMVNAVLARIRRLLRQVSLVTVWQIG